MPSERSEPPTYAERLLPPWPVWAFMASIVVGVVAAVLPLVPPVVAPPLLLLGLAGGSAALYAWSGWVSVTGGELRAGRAHIPVALLGQPQPLLAEPARRRLGADFDPRAYHFVRGWVRTGLVVDVRDPADPTPYWYVSTRHPDRLAAVIEAARRGAAP